VTYFFDNNIAPAIAEALRVLRQDTVHIADCATRGIVRDDTDIAWMPKVAKVGWFAVTVDNNIHRRREEKAAREACGLRVVYLPGTFGRARPPTLGMQHRHRLLKSLPIGSESGDS
jgi:hypothetical protein